jgi:hypothetical protein
MTVHLITEPNQPSMGLPRHRTNFAKNFGVDGPMKSAIKTAAIGLDTQKLEEERAAAIKAAADKAAVTKRVLQRFFSRGGMPEINSIVTKPVFSRNIRRISVQPNPDIPPLLQRVQQAWRSIAQASASCCFTPDGQIDLTQAGKLQRFWQDADLTNPPFNTIPGIELVREQTLAVLEKLTQTPSPLQNTLNEALGKIPNSNVEPLLANMGISFHVSNRMGQAILQSLFTPHRQMCLPTCSINALINAEIFNHPERLANIYTQILTKEPGEEITLPICPNNQIQLQSISGMPRAIRATFNQSKESIENAFSDLLQGSPTSTIPSSYKTHGIGIRSFPSQRAEDGQISFSLNLPVHDLNDAFFANFVHAIYQGTDQSKVFIEVRNLYFGIPGNNFAERSIFNAYLDEVCFSKEKIGKLMDEAKRLVNTGNQYALVTVFSNQRTISFPTNAGDNEGELSPYRGHVENINLRQLANLDINGLAAAGQGAMWMIGDRNWVNKDTGAPTYLSIYKMENDQYCILAAEYSPDRISLAPSVPIGGLALYPPN